MKNSGFPHMHNCTLQNDAQWRYHTIQNGEAEIIHDFGQCLHHSRGCCGIHSDNIFAVQEWKSCLCSSQWPDKPVELKSEPADLVKIKRLLVFTRCWMEFLHVLLSVTIFRIPSIELNVMTFNISFDYWFQCN